MSTVRSGCLLASYCLVAAACCLVPVSGCKSGPDPQGGSSWWKNPFKSTASHDEKPSSRQEHVAKSKGGKDKSAPSFAEELARGRALEKAGKYDEARSVYQRLIVNYPDRYEAYHRLAVVADRQKRFREAEGLFGEAIRLEPKNADLFNDLGYCQFLQGKLDKAEASLLKAVSLAPSNPRYRNNLGMVYGHQGRYEEALAEFRRAGSDADAYYNLAFVKAARNDFDGAKECFHRALAADPGFEPARRALASFAKAEEDPVGELTNDPVVENGTYWVPYVEGSESANSGAQTASHSAPASETAPATEPREAVRQPRATAQSQLQRARADAATRIQQGFSQ